MTEVFTSLSLEELETFWFSLHNNVKTTSEVGDLKMLFFEEDLTLEYIQNLLENARRGFDEVVLITELCAMKGVKREEAEVLAWVHNNTDYRLEGVQGRIVDRPIPKNIKPEVIEVIADPKIVWQRDNVPHYAVMSGRGAVDLTYLRARNLNFAKYGFTGIGPLVANIHYKMDGYPVRMISLGDIHIGAFFDGVTTQIRLFEHSYGGVVEYIPDKKIFYGRDVPINNDSVIQQPEYTVGGCQIDDTDGIIIETLIQEYKVKFDKTYDLEIKGGQLFGGELRPNTTVDLSDGIYECTTTRIGKRRLDKNVPNTPDQIRLLKTAMEVKHFEMFYKRLKPQLIPLESPQLDLHLLQVECRIDDIFDIVRYEDAVRPYVTCDNLYNWRRSLEYNGIFRSGKFYRIHKRRYVGMMLPSRGEKFNMCKHALPVIERSMKPRVKIKNRKLKSQIKIK